MSFARDGSNELSAAVELVRKKAARLPAHRRVEAEAVGARTHRCRDPVERSQLVDELRRVRGDRRPELVHDRAAAHVRLDESVGGVLVHRLGERRIVGQHGAVGVRQDLEPVDRVLAVAHHLPAVDLLVQELRARILRVPLRDESLEGALVGRLHQRDEVVAASAEVEPHDVDLRPERRLDVLAEVEPGIVSQAALELVDALLLVGEPRLRGRRPSATATSLHRC